MSAKLLNDGCNGSNARKRLENGTIPSPQYRRQGGNVSTAAALHGGGASRGIRPDNRSFLAAINAWGKSDDPDGAVRAERLLEEMQRRDNDNYRAADGKNNNDNNSLSPTTEIYTAVMDAWARRPNAGRKVEAMLLKLEQGYESHGNALVRPSAITYTTAIRAWGNTATREAPERALGILRRMERLGQTKERSDLLPGSVALSTSLQAWSKSKRKDAPDVALSSDRPFLPIRSECYQTCVSNEHPYR